MLQWYKFIFAIGSFFALTAASAPPSQVSIDTDISLAVGQAVAIESENLVIKFNKVIEDSRCPVNAVCVWAGNGKVELEIQDIGGTPKTMILNTQIEAKVAALKSRKLRLVALNPPRTQGVSISPGGYSITLRVEK